MGFLSKLAKKAKPFLPYLAMLGAGPLMGAFGATGAMSGGLGTLFGGMNPVMANALKQGMLNYGVGKLTGAKHPEKGAMWAGLASVPFSLMGGASAASAFNKEYNLSPGDEGFRNMWDVLSTNKYQKIPYGDPMEVVARSKPQIEYGMGLEGTDRIMGPSRVLGKSIVQPSIAAPRAASMFTKPEMINPKTGMPAIFGGGVPTGGTTFRMTPTLASQTAGMYGGAATDEEKWLAAKEKRRKELAWMYGVDPELIEGEMTNPWSTGAGGFGGFWNKGGIASLENGGDVSGPGTGTSDSINANLSDGEFVMTAQAVENLGGGDRYEGARKMYDMMNVLDPESETMQEVV